MVQNLKKHLRNRKFQKKIAFQGTKCRAEAVNNRETVIVWARHVVKRPKKRSALVHPSCVLIQ